MTFTATELRLLALSDEADNQPRGAPRKYHDNRARKARERVMYLRRQGMGHLEAAVWNQYRRELEKLRADRLGVGSSASTARG